MLRPNKKSNITTRTILTNRTPVSKEIAKEKARKVYNLKTNILANIGPNGGPGILATTHIGSTFITYEWLNPCTNCSGVSVYHSTGSTKPPIAAAILLPTSTRHSFQNLQTATTYYVWVEFFNKYGTGTERSILAHTTEEAPNAAPSNITFVPGATSIALSFTNAATNDDGVKIYRAPFNTQPVIHLDDLTGTNITSYTDDNLGSGLDTATEYYYWVSNYNEIAESSTTSGSTFTLEVAPDAAPSNIIFVPGATSIALSFTNAATNDDGVKIYRNTISMKPALPHFNLTGTNITSYTDDASGGGLSEGTLYYYWVSNFNEIAESSTVSGATTTQTSGTTWYHAHGGAMQQAAVLAVQHTVLRLNNPIGHHHNPPTIAVGDYLKLDNEEMLVTSIPYTTRPVVTRAQNGTTAVVHAAGTDVYVDHS